MASVRYDIETSPAPHKEKVPNKYYPSFGRSGLATLIIREFIHYTRLALLAGGWRHPVRCFAEIGDQVTSRPCIYGVLDRPVGGMAPIRRECTGCMRCAQEQPNFARVTLNPEFFKQGDSYFTPDAVETLLLEASTGQVPVGGMGYKGCFVGGEDFDAMLCDFSEIVRPSRDGIYGREYISTQVDLGRKLPRLFTGAKERVIQAPVPVLFDFLPDLSSHAPALESIAAAARRLGTRAIFAFDNYLSCSADNRSALIPLVTPSDLEKQYCAGLENADFIELDCSGTDTAGDTEAVGVARKANPAAVLSVRLPFSCTGRELFRRMYENGVDVFHLCADYHGRVAAQGAALHLKDAIARAHADMMEEGMREEVTLLASGGVVRAEHVPKAVMCGADAVALDTPVLMALHARLPGEYVAPGGEVRLPKDFPPEWGAQRLVNFIASWRNQLLEVASAMGIRDVRRLRGESGRAMFFEELAARVPLFG